METTPSKKRKIENGQDTPSKKKKFLSFKEKLDLIKRHNDGATNSKIARDTGIPEPTVRRTVKNKNEIKKQATRIGAQCCEYTGRSNAFFLFVCRHHY